MDWGELAQLLGQYGAPWLLLGYVLNRILFPLKEQLEAQTRRLDVLTAVIARRDGQDLVEMRKMFDLKGPE